MSLAHPALHRQQRGLSIGIAIQAAGLLAISIGLSRLYPNDHEMLQAGMVVYDALYEWRDSGQAETHKWQAHELPSSLQPRAAIGT